MKDFKIQSKIDTGINNDTHSLKNSRGHIHIQQSEFQKVEGFRSPCFNRLEVDPAMRTFRLDGCVTGEVGQNKRGYPTLFFDSFSRYGNGFLVKDNSGREKVFHFSNGYIEIKSFGGMKIFQGELKLILKQVLVAFKKLSS